MWQKNQVDAEPPSKVTPQVLLDLDALEERLEISGPESLVVVPLDDLDEHGRTVLQGLRENLKRGTFFNWHLHHIRPLGPLVLLRKRPQRL